MLSKRFLRPVFRTPVFVLAVALSLSKPAGATGLEEDAADFIRSLSQDAIESLTRKETAREARIGKFRDLFNKHFAVKSIGRFVLGRNWRKATKDERAEYLKLFEDLMVVSYVDRFKRYAGDNLEIAKTRAENETTVTVFSLLPRDAGKPVNILWRVGVLKKSGGVVMKILDVVVEGASMSQTLRSDFGSIIRQRDGKVSGLIEELRLKTAALKNPDKAETSKN
ncbi:MAG: ABC transporter substrate-binding protein [Rhodospirillales bacterium]|nr:ABC transporter substrate-binding protein [Alphaproteobacteria bacterium]MBL6947215.1 ABC transporter substrate-binding protein [Rhodospirillales bacterium]